MPHIYKVAELRPMRDMDILMPVEQLQKAASVMRELGYNLPTEQPSKFMRDMHQLPNASKKVNGFFGERRAAQRWNLARSAGSLSFPHG